MPIPDKPITREEMYLNTMAGGAGVLPDEPITRKEKYLAKAAGVAVETPEPVTREEMYLAEIANGGGSGGASSLNDLSDVKITNPTVWQTLVYRESPSPGFTNRQYPFARLAGISNNVPGAGITLLSTSGDGAVFDYYQCVESPNFGASIAQGFEQVITVLKPVAKSAGKAGTKVPAANAASLVSSFANIQDTKKRVPVAIFGDYVFFPKGRISSTKFLFSSADTDSDGVYDIIFAVDANASAVYVTVEYTACPAMS